MKTITKFIYPAFAVFAIACFALSPTAQAVTPAPDGGYPNENTAEGDDALFSLTTISKSCDVVAVLVTSTGVNEQAFGTNASTIRIARARRAMRNGALCARRV